MENIKKENQELYLDIGILVLHGEMLKEKPDILADYKVYINIETQMPVYIPLNKVKEFESFNMILKRRKTSLKEEWKEIKEMSNWYQEELEIHTPQDATKNLIRKQKRSY